MQKIHADTITPCKQRISQDNGNNELNNDILYVLYHCFLFHLLQ